MTARDRALSITLENGVLWREDVDQIEAAIIAHAAELEAENARLRKVVAAVVAWYDCYHNIEAYPAAFYALIDAVREYRKELPQNCHNEGLGLNSILDINLTDREVVKPKADGE